MKQTKYTSKILTLFFVLLVGCAPPTPSAPEAGPEAAPEAAPTTPAETGPIRIGFIGPLSGDAAGLGADDRAGVELAVKEINDAGGINGRTLEVIFEDGKCNGKDANTAATKLIDVDKVPVIIGGLCSSETLAAAPLAEAAKVALISPASSNPSITQAGDFVFRVWPSDTGQGKAMAEYLNSKNIKKVGIIYMNQDYNLGLATAFKQNFEALGGQVVAWETYEQDAKDFRTQIAKARAARPDAIYLVPYSVDGGLLVKQIRELKITLPLYGSETLGSKESVEAAGKENIEGLIYATPKFDSEWPKAKEFLPKATALKGSDLSIPAIAANAYDAAYLVAEAFKQKGISGEAVRDYLYTVKDYDGAGGKLTIDSNGDALKEFQLMQIKNGEFVKLE